MKHPLKNLTESLSKLIPFRSKENVKTSNDSLSDNPPTQPQQNTPLNVLNPTLRGSDGFLNGIKNNNTNTALNAPRKYSLQATPSSTPMNLISQEGIQPSATGQKLTEKHQAEQKQLEEAEERDVVTDLDSSQNLANSGSNDDNNGSGIKGAKSLPKLNFLHHSHKKSASATPQFSNINTSKDWKGSHDRALSNKSMGNGVLGNSHYQLQGNQKTESGAGLSSINDLSLVRSKTTALSLYEVSTPSTSYSLSDLHAVKKVGKGGFATVFLVRERRSHQYFALKALKKSLILKMKQEKQIINEKNILSNVSHPMIVELFATFQDDTYLYMMLEYVAGGDLFSFMRKVKILPEAHAKFYGASMILAIEYLHQQSIIYRDLKPENILMDTNGNIKLTDFGFAKRIIDTTNSFCGTPDYIALEIVEGISYTHSVDWWSLGVLLFEMITGRTPFYDNHVERIYNNIQNLKIQWSDKLSPPIKDLIKRLITVSKHRLDVKGIKRHVWFMSMDWDKLETRSIPPPYIPAAEPLEKYESVDKLKIKDPEMPMSVEQQKKMVDAFRGF